MRKTSGFVAFLYGTLVGRLLLKTIMKLHLDRLATHFLRSSASKILIGRYANKNGIALTKEQRASFGTFRDFLYERERMCLWI